MRYFFILCCLIGEMMSAQAQNIVPNPNFALYDTCPANYSQMSRCRYWRTVTKTTPDYFNSCAPSSSAVTIPQNWAGYQQSADHAYAGLYVFGNGGNWHEYIGTNIPALTPGATYRVSMKIALGETLSKYATEAPSLYFYIAAKPDSTNNTYLPLTPQMTFSSYGIVYDTDWVLLTGSFIADSAYTHLCIGMFKHDTSILKDTSIVPATNSYTYYYIDSVAVEQMNKALIDKEAVSKAPTIYPNPFSGSAVLSFPNPDILPHTLCIFDLSGRLIRKTENVTEDTITIERLNLYQGIYYYKLSGTGRNDLYGKMVVE